MAPTKGMSHQSSACLRLVPMSAFMNGRQALQPNDVIATPRLPMSSMIQEDEILGKAYDQRLMGRLLTYLRPYRGLLVVAFLLIFATGGTDLVPPYLVKLAIDQAIVPRQPESLPWIFAV